MKNLIFSLVLLLLGSAAIAQDVYIPDVNLKNKLLNHDPVIDTNGDGEIQVSEAEAVTGTLNLNSVLQPSVISDPTGLEAFINITGLILSSNNILSIDVSMFSHLELLDLAYNWNLSSIDVSQNTLLERLDISNANLTSIELDHTNLKRLELPGNELQSIDLSGVPNLEFLNLDGWGSSNKLDQIDLSFVPNLEGLIIHSQNLTTIDISMLPHLDIIWLQYNPLASIDLTNNSALESLWIAGTDIVELDVSHNSNLAYLKLAGNPNLTYVNLKNGNTDLIDLQNGFYLTPNVEVVCVDDFEALDNTYYQQLTDIGAVVTTDCSFSPAEYNIVEGQLSFDTGGGCDATTALALPNTLMKTINGNNSFGTVTNSNGEYDIHTDEGVNTTVVQSNLPSYFYTAPGSFISNFSGYGNTDVADFCLSSDQTVNDLNITFFATEMARPGFYTTYKIVYENMGTTVMDGSITMEFDSGKQNFSGAIPNENSFTSNSITFDFTGLQPVENREIEIEMQTFAPPTLVGGEELNFMVSITPNNDDYTPNDNIFHLEQTVVNSYDPNDKQVLEGEEIGIAQAGDYLHYMVRFQNTGTASAINVVVADTLSSQLNWDSMRMVSASHDYRVQITNDNFVEFIFEGIDLPHEAADEAGSNGYVVYKIKPVDGLQVGDVIHGLEAGIYFDFNPPIITNEADTEIVEETASTEIFDFENSIKIHPNPTNGIVNISAGNGMEVQKVEVYSVSGQKLLQEQAVNNIDISNLPQGLYFVKIYSAEGAEVVKKIIKN